MDASDASGERIGSPSPIPQEFRWRSGPLAPLSLMTILDEVHPWIIERVHPGLALISGATDRWAAADLAGWLNKAAGGRPDRVWDIEFDAPIYDDPDLTVALLYNRRTATAACPMLAMGVRVQSQLYSAARFGQGIEAELGRLERQPRRAEFEEAEEQLLVVTVDAAGLSTALLLGLEVRTMLPDGRAALWKRVRRAGRGPVS